MISNHHNVNENVFGKMLFDRQLCIVEEELLLKCIYDKFLTSVFRIQLLLL